MQERAKPRKRIAKIDGAFVEYKACSTRKNTYKKQEKSGFFEYIGNGTIHAIDDVLQSGLKKYHFWK